MTAAHVAGAKPRVRIANLELSAKVLKAGDLRVDLTLLAVDQEQLPVSLGLRRMPLCQNPPQTGQAVIVATPEAIAPSTILSPQLLPADVQTKFPTLIKDVATTGNSGSGVFDARRQCLLGIITRKLYMRANKSIVARQMHIAKYFVPAATIAAFIPGDYHY